MTDPDFSAPLKIDPFLTLEHRVLPAPMAGVMNPVFCLAASRMGLIQNWFTPFLSISRDSVPSYAALKKKIQPFLNGKNLIVQLLGHDGDSLAATAVRLEELGVQSVNLNFACPAPLVGKNGNGGILLKDPEKIYSLTKAVADAVSGKMNVSVKLRCGWSEPEAELPEIASAVTVAGVRFVIAHFRTVTEMYEPVPPDAAYHRLALLRSLLPPDAILFGNGDIRSLDHAVRMSRRTGCDGVAAARAIPANPFLLQRIASGSDAPPDETEKLQFLRETALAAKSLHCRMNKWAGTGFLEFAGMCFGKNSETFCAAVRDPVMFLRKKLQIELAE